MPETRKAVPARGDIAAARPRTGRSLGEAITALRRGEPVLIRDDLISVLAVAAELVNEANLRRLREISGAPARQHDARWRSAWRRARNCRAP